jgi:hypothetical protein
MNAKEILAGFLGKKGKTAKPDKVKIKAKTATAAQIKDLTVKMLTDLGYLE